MFVCAAPAFSASDSAAPDWLRAAAREILPQYPPETVAVVVLDEQQTTVKDNGKIETVHRRAVRILRPEAREDFSRLFVEFDSDTKIPSMKAWTITSDGHELSLTDADAVERSVYNEEMYTDVHLRALKFLEVNPGSVIGYEYVQEQRPFMYEDRWDFQDRVPVRTSRFILQLPTGWEYSSQWINYKEQQARDTPPNQHLWQVQDVPAVDIEPAMPPWDSIAARMGVKYFPHDPQARSKTDMSWKDMGLWFDGLTQSSRVPTPQLKEKVAGLTMGISDPAARMRMLTEYMQSQIRYFAIEIGIGGYQPHPAGEVFAHQYGDCKDKATLLSAMLGEIGIDSYYVLIHTRRGVVRPDYPTIQFNHAILAIRVPGGIDDNAFPASVKHPTLGRLLFFDPTNEYVPLGYLPSYLQDNYGLVVTPDGGELIRLPLLSPNINRLLRTGTFALADSGNLSGEIHEMRWGGPAADDRRHFEEEQPSKRVDVFEKFLAASLNNFSITNASIGNLESNNEALTLDYKFVSQAYARNAGDLLIIRPRVVGETYSSILEGKPRKYPIEFREATRQDDMFDITIPPGYVVDELPPPVSVESEYASYQSQIQFSGDTLHYKRTYQIKQLVVPTEKLNDIKTFFERAASDENASAVFRRANP
jgi:hypothetical protein